MYPSYRISNDEKDMKHTDGGEKMSPSKLYFQIDNITEENNINNEDDVRRTLEPLPYVTACLFATVLEDAITTMRILGECNNSLRVTKTMADMDELLALKFSVAPAPVSDPLQKIKPSDLERGEYKLNKLETDRNFLLNVLTSTYLDLSLKKRYQALMDYADQMIGREKYFLSLLEDETRNRTARRELNRQIRQQRVHVKSVTYDTDMAIEKLKTQVEVSVNKPLNCRKRCECQDAALHTEIQTRYVENWERSRTEQHQQNIADKESPASNTIESYKMRIDHEQRVHSEFELLTNIIINETLNKVENWMDKYDKDMEAMDLKIQIMRSDYENTLEERLKLEETLKKHANLMKEWVQFKEDREKARQYRERMFNAAVVVQAWWRGLLVRQKLGPYRVVKKKKTAKK
ncbi:unnamed protein product [Parnassius apollo]|uniref:Dynein regulatory complex protein 9 n=1 Tax=Parnassius apollo TaxID=110799 RepID=A0A8S3VZW9_PARAO|nr:unnamed protein product [Parnassius apollo]